MTQILLHFTTYTQSDDAFPTPLCTPGKTPLRVQTPSCPLGSTDEGSSGAFERGVPRWKDGRRDGVRGRPPAPSSARGGPGAAAASLRGGTFRRRGRLDGQRPSQDQQR
ncbi:hypothetical protein TNCT_487601 [Trichonephila clavata]|uniref:Uncharacterized protein n=1 Tax=Trichonephila clavata TaxID=2740835 RepID=A0A8X6LWP8_TRICU|nr:hypothetical protein TNCT_487601 [Trichonephila clavata]